METSIRLWMDLRFWKNKALWSYDETITDLEVYYDPWNNYLTTIIEHTQGGAKRTRPSRPTPKWVSTGRKVTLKDGSKRSLYKNAGKPGELRIRRMATRAGKSVATYVKPPR